MSKKRINPGNIPMRVPAHGKGKLRVGNPEATGRPPSAIRAAMRQSLDQRIAIAEEIADDGQASPAERLKALELLARYGLGHSDSVTTKARFSNDDERRQRLRELLERIEQS